MQSDRQVGTDEWRSRTPERVTPQTDPDRRGGIARLEGGDEEVLPTAASKILPQGRVRRNGCLAAR